MLELRYEHVKLSSSYLKHITSLSAGAIVLQVGFLEKVFPHPKYKLLIAASLILFTLTVICSTLVQWFVLASLNPAAKERLWPMLFFFVMWLCFICGLGLAVLFALINLFTL